MKKSELKNRISMLEEQNKKIREDVKAEAVRRKWLHERYILIIVLLSIAWYVILFNSNVNITNETRFIKSIVSEDNGTFTYSVGFKDNFTTEYPLSIGDKVEIEIKSYRMAPLKTECKFLGKVK